MAPPHYHQQPLLLHKWLVYIHLIFSRHCKHDCERRWLSKTNTGQRCHNGIPLYIYFFLFSTFSNQNCSFLLQRGHCVSLCLVIDCSIYILCVRSVVITRNIYKIDMSPIWPGKNTKGDLNSSLDFSQHRQQNASTFAPSNPVLSPNLL